MLVMPRLPGGLDPCDKICSSESHLPAISNISQNVFYCTFAGIVQHTTVVRNVTVWLIVLDNFGWYYPSKDSNNSLTPHLIQAATFP